MCGIAGVLNFRRQAVDPSLLQAMTDLLAHRGPDGQGQFSEDAVGLGHRRLAVVDPTPEGAQPMVWRERGLAITFNGEIFNFRDLRRELMGKGHAFHSHTDTEVILHAYAEWGEECLSRFNGMFAFALWDSREKSLWLARDRLGVKPLFFALDDHSLVFASEIKAVLRHPQVKRELDVQALAYYLALNYLPIPFTLFQSVRQLMPGTHMRLHADGRVVTKTYWEWQPDPTPMSEAEALQGFSDRFGDAVNLRMLADVPVGCFLSGGVDSSAIAWAASRDQSQVKTFSVGFADARFDERPRARRIADHLGSEHFDTDITDRHSELLPKLAWHAEEPTADSSMLGVYQLSAMARKKVVVALSGDGADEILAGYPTYPAFFLHGLARHVPNPLRQWAAKGVSTLLPETGGKVAWDEKARRFLASLDIDSSRVPGAWRLIHDASTRERLLAPLAGNPNAKADALDLFGDLYSSIATTDPLARLLAVDTRLYLPSDMLVKADRMGMAHGLEIRTPFLDYRLVEWLGQVPSHFKLRRGKGKWLLRRFLRGKLPNGMEAGPKRGFNMPMSQWLRGDMKSFVGDHLNETALKPLGFIDGTAVAQRVQEHLSGQRDHSHSLWGLLSLKLWWDLFLSGRELAPP